MDNLEAFVSENRNKLTWNLADYSINEPVFTSWIKKMNEARPLSRDTAMLLEYIKELCNNIYSQLTYISLHEFQEIMFNVMSSVIDRIAYSAQNEDIYIVIMDKDTLDRSNIWVLFLVFPLIKEYIAGFVSVDNIPQLHDCSLLYIDDGIYSGTQFMENMGSVLEVLPVNNLFLYPCVALIGDNFYLRLQQHANIIVSASTRIVPNIVEHYIDIDVNNTDPDYQVLVEFLQNYFCVFLDNCTCTYFQHKMAGGLSLPVPIVESGFYIDSVNGHYQIKPMGNIVKNCKSRLVWVKPDFKNKPELCPPGFYKDIAYTYKGRSVGPKTSMADLFRVVQGS